MQQDRLIRLPQSLFPQYLFLLAKEEDRNLSLKQNQLVRVIEVHDQLIHCKELREIERILV